MKAATGETGMVAARVAAVMELVEVGRAAMVAVEAALSWN